MEFIVTDLKEITVPALKYIYPFLAILIVVEFVKARHLYNLKESLSGFGIAAGASLVAFFSKFYEVALITLFFTLFEPLRESLLGYSSFGWAWYVWIIAIFCDDFSFYWHHRLSHNIRLLWAAHVPHHSGMMFNLTISIRNGWFITLYKPIFWIWMGIIGFEPLMIAAAIIINSAYQFFLHSQLVPSLGPIEKVFNTPYVHQVHHSSNLEYLDKNHGGIFTIWDRLFGTWQDVDPNIKPVYGVLHGPKNYNPIEANIHEFRDIWNDLKKARSAREVFGYIFGPPGWSPDGKSMTAKEIQRELQLAKLENRTPNIGEVKAV
jgi:sterol desaturase/sphingolipid hydroxylase (fatty acid hydroxylase superfamily)